MKQYLFVHIPGFEYKSKGPLHIDAIKLEVNRTEEISEESSSTAIPVYWDISGSYSDNTSPTFLEGNIIYRAIIPGSTTVVKKSTLDDEIKNDHTAYPSYTNDYKVTLLDKDYYQDLRAPKGYYYDYILNSDSQDVKLHRIQYKSELIYTNDEQEKLFTSDLKNSISNLNLQEHDGIFILQIDELNINLSLHFTFYSRINTTETGMEFGTVEATNGNDTPSHTEIDLTKYAIIGTWDTTYNPTYTNTLNINYSLPAEELNYNRQSQYYDLKDWGADENKEWEVPVNAGILCGRKSEVRPIGGFSAFKLYSYDTDNLSSTYRTHKYSQLGCDNYTSIIDYYGNFYTHEVQEYKFSEDLKEIQTFSINTIGKYYGYNCEIELWSRTQGLSSDLFKNWDTCVAPIQLTIGNINIPRISPKYQLKETLIDLHNFHYLYNNDPIVSINNIRTNDNYLDAASCNFIGFLGFRFYSPYRGIFTDRNTDSYRGIWCNTGVVPFEQNTDSDRRSNTKYYSPARYYFNLGLITDVEFCNNFTYFNGFNTIASSTSYTGMKSLNNLGNSAQFNICYCDVNKNMLENTSLYRKQYYFTGNITDGNTSIGTIQSNGIFNKDTVGDDLKSYTFTFDNNQIDLKNTVNSYTGSTLYESLIKYALNKNNIEYDRNQSESMFKSYEGELKVTTPDLAVNFTSDNNRYSFGPSTSHSNDVVDFAYLNNTSGPNSYSLYNDNNRLYYNSLAMFLRFSGTFGTPIRLSKTLTYTNDNTIKLYDVQNYLVPIRLDGDPEGYGGITIESDSILNNGVSKQYEIKEDGLFSISFNTNIIIPFAVQTWIGSGKDRQGYNFRGFDGFTGEMNLEIQKQIQFLNQHSMFTPIIGLSSMFMIDLDNSDITRSNKGDFTINPIVVNNISGFGGENFVESNFKNPINLLLRGQAVPEGEYEIKYCGIIPNTSEGETLSFVSPINLKKDSNTTYDTSFCTEDRFIQPDSQGSIKLSTNVELKSKEAYLFKILVYPNNTTYWINVNGKSEFNQCDPEKGILIYNATSSSETITEIGINFKDPTSDEKVFVNNTGIYVGAIGLYKFDLTQLDLNTQVLLNALIKSDQGVLFTSEPDYLDLIILPSALCVKEDETFAKCILDGYDTLYSGLDYAYVKDFDNKYWTYDPSGNITDPIVRHYDFHYLPREAYYKIDGYYKLPNKRNNYNIVISKEMFENLDLDGDYKKSESSGFIKAITDTNITSIRIKELAQ